jgi:hypothetical protein
MDELEWRREDAKLGADERDRAVDDVIALVGAVNDILELQADADMRYFAAAVGRTLDQAEYDAVAQRLLEAYRWQYIISGVQHPRFRAILGELIDQRQGARIAVALAPLL